jgi:glycopeptide antibiotics resistance protein
MSHILSMLSGMVPGVILILAVAAILSRVFRHSAPTPLHTVGALLYAIVVTAVLSVTGVPGLPFLRFHPVTAFVPFYDIGNNTIQYVQNILLFLPLGFLLPTLWIPFRRAWRTVLFGAVFSCAIEASQLFCYRSTDLDDVLMNTLGAFLGFLLFRLMRRLPLFRRCFSSASSARAQPVLLLLAAWAVMFLVQPYLEQLL